jgi:glycosyltransferase involved in cell wall biosynthesis
VKLLLLGRWRTENPGGPDAVILNLSREFVAVGHEVTVWSPNKRVGEVTPSRLENGVRIVELPAFAKLPMLRPAAARWIESHGGDFDGALLYSVFTPLNVLIARKLRCPYAAVPLGGYARASVRQRSPIKKKVFLALYERAFLEQASFVNVWSRNEQEDVALLARARRYVITPPGFNAVPMPSRPPAAPLPGRRLLFLGRFAIEHKGLDRLIDSFARVAGPDDSLTLAGADYRGSIETLRRQVAASPARDRIAIEGPAWGNAKYALFQRHDVFVHLSRWEGMPLAVVEALAFGMPVLLSKATNAGEYVHAHGAGWVVEDGDFDSGTRRALESTAEELDRMSAGAHRLVSTEFRWDAMAARLIAAFAA